MRALIASIKGASVGERKAVFRLAPA